MTSHPLRLDRLQAGLMVSLAAALTPGGWGMPWGALWGAGVEDGPTILWAPSEYPRAAARSRVVTVRILSGPTSSADSVKVWRLPTVARLVIASSAVGHGLRLSLSGRAWEIETAATVTETRDRMLAEILDSGIPTMVSAEFEADGADAIRITAHALGDLYHVRVRCTLPGMASIETVEVETAEVQISTERTLVELQAYSSSRYPRDGATATLKRWQNTSRLSHARAVFDAFGLTVASLDGTPVNLDDMAGATWQSRAALPVYVSQLAIAAAPVETIEHVRFGAQLRGADQPLALDLEVSQ